MGLVDVTISLSAMFADGRWVAVASFFIFGILEQEISSTLARFRTRSFCHWQSICFKRNQWRQLWSRRRERLRLYFTVGDFDVHSISCS